MVINTPKLAVILVAGVLLNLAGTALVHRIAVYLLCPEPGINLASFDLLRIGMSSDRMLARVRPEHLILERRMHGLAPFNVNVDLNGRHVWHFDRDGIELEIETVNGILIDGTATCDGRVVRQHLEPRDPILDTLRAVVLRLESTVMAYRPLELLCYPAALMAGIALVVVLRAARNAQRLEPQ